MDLNTKLDQCQTENYLLNNNCIVWDEERELLGNLKFYVRHTGLIENSPWAENSNPLDYYQKKVYPPSRKTSSTISTKIFSNTAIQFT